LVGIGVGCGNLWVNVEKAMPRGRVQADRRHRLPAASTFAGGEHSGSAIVCLE
jgi:hypothetical protein